MFKILIYGGIIAGGLLGAYLPVLMIHANPLGFISILSSFFGSLLGLIIGYKIYKNYFD